jgi:hypothetical protein
MMRAQRGQSSVEFIILASVMLVGVSAIMVVAQGFLAQANHEKDQATLQAVETAITQELGLADRAATGYSRTFILPASIKGVAYTISIIEETPPRADAMIITWGNATTLIFLDPNVNGTLTPGTNTIVKNARGIGLNKVP